MSIIENIVTMHPLKEMRDLSGAAVQPALGVEPHFADEACLRAKEPHRSQGTANPGDWKVGTIEIYRSGKANMAQDLQADLANRLLALIGREIPTGSVYVNSEARTARVSIDGVSFRLMRDRLVLLAPCAYCGVREFESPALESRADLGYALSDWKPYCPDCMPLDQDQEDWD
jgi:hypothetical protein